MKKFGRILSVVLCFVMLLAFAACSKAPEKTDDTGLKTVESGKLIMATMLLSLHMNIMKVTRL